MDTKQIVSKFKKARENKKLTQEQVAKKAGLNTNYYAVIERGEVKEPSLDYIQKICKILGIKFVIG